MSDVLAIFGILLALGIIFPGYLTAAWLVFPERIERARQRLDSSLAKCFWLGAGLAILLLIPLVALISASGPFALLGWVLLGVLLLFATPGAAGLSLKMAQTLIQRSGANLSPAAAFVRGAAALELAAALPLLGWLAVLPMALFASLGAAVLSLFRPAPRPAAPLVPAAPTATLTPQS